MVGRSNKKGMALLLVLTSIAIMAVIMLELSYTTKVTNSMTANFRDEVASEYLAKSSVKIEIGRAHV